MTKALVSYDGVFLPLHCLFQLFSGAEAVTKSVECFKRLLAFLSNPNANCALKFKNAVAFLSHCTIM